TSSTSVCTRSSLRWGRCAGPIVCERCHTIAGANRQEEGSAWTGGATGALPRTKRGWIVYARSTTIQAQPSSIDAGIAHVRDEVMPALPGMAGCIGLSLLVDRQSGRCIVTSAWETEDAMRDSEEQVRPIRD